MTDEIRNPKAEIRRKAEARSSKPERRKPALSALPLLGERAGVRGNGTRFRPTLRYVQRPETRAVISVFGFRISSRRAVAPSQRVGLRISAFGFLLPSAPCNVCS